MGDSFKLGLCVGTVLRWAFMWGQCYVGLLLGTVLRWAYVGDSVKLGLCGEQC